MKKEEKTKDLDEKKQNDLEDEAKKKKTNKKLNKEEQSGKEKKQNQANKETKKEVVKNEKIETEEKKEQKPEKNSKKGKEHNEEQKAVKEEKMPKQEKNSKQEKPKKEKKKLKLIISIAIIIIAILFFSTIFALLNMGNEKMLDGISILGIDVSNLTIEEATNKINDAIESRFDDENNNLILKRNNEETSVTANTFNSKFDVEKAIAEAHNIGRNGNILTNNYAILFTKIFKKDIQPELYLDEELLNTTIKDINAKMQDAVVESSYYVEDETLTIVRGKAGYIIDDEELKGKIYAQINNIHTNYQTIEIPTIYKEPDPIDIEKIHDEIYKEPQDAYVEKNPTTVHPDVNGIDFDISIEKAKELLEKDKEEYEIPLKITKPKITISDLGEEAFPDLIASFSTIYDPSNRNRSNNIELASKKVNGTIILPGEKFSYNTVVGKRTLEAGYKEGTAYIGGKVVPDVGGGVCQLSSTLYNAALYANLDIVERSNHLFLTGYVSASRDATVYYGSVDFVFKNSRTYPIKIVTNSSNGVCKVSIYGIKEKTEYEVVIQSKVTSYINYTTKYVDDPTLEEGKEVVEQAGSNGCRSEGYKILKHNGKVISQTLLSKDTYSAMQRVVRRGTKKKEVVNTNANEITDENTIETNGEPVEENVTEPINEVQTPINTLVEDEEEQNNRK